MFGLIYTLFQATMLVGSSIKNAFTDAQRKEAGKRRYSTGEDKTGTYFDRTGIRRNLSDNNPVTIRPDYDDPCDDKWMWVGFPSIKTRNISEEERARQFEETKTIGDFKGRTVDVYNSRHWASSRRNEDKVVIKGAFYKDLQTGETYVCREFKVTYDKGRDMFTHIPKYLRSVKPDLQCKYYMNVSSGKLIRVADTQELKYSEELSEKFIYLFNTAQSRGGWYKSERGNSPLKKKQDYYCNDLDALDHIYSLYQLREKESKEAKVVTENLRKELRDI